VPQGSALRIRLPATDFRSAVGPHGYPDRIAGGQNIRPTLPASKESSADVADAMGLSARGYHRVLRVTRTLADLDGRDQVARLHIAEALSYRQKLAAFQAAA
jgi:Magnesium chelatase, subunit ChlI C-terminal